MSNQDDIRNASKQFYAALNRMATGDASSLSQIWSHSGAVTAMHPIGGRQVGWDAVRTSFDQVAALASDGQVELKDQLIHASGDVAWEVGVEQGRFTMAGQEVAIQHRVTNVYQNEGGAWKIVHHHTDLSPAMVDLLSRLQPPTK